MIKEISINDIDIYKKEALKANLVFCKKTILFGLFDDNKLVAFGGILFFKNKAILKNFFVPVEHRGKSYFKMLFNFCITLCNNIGIKKLEATCTEMSINTFLKHGFKPIKKYKNLTKVIYENI